MPAPDTSQHKIGVFALAMINVAAIVSLRNLPVMAEYGLGMIFYYGLSAFCFFIPTALVAAELATAWPDEGGVYLWVREALGERMGFLAIWMQAVNNVVWFPTVLSFVAGALAFAVNPQLADNRYYTLAVILGVFWAATFANFRGMKVSGLISSVGSIAGTLLPGAVIILVGAWWTAAGHASQTPLEFSALVPELDSIRQVVFLAGALVGLTGMEMSAVHALDVDNPRTDYPKAIFVSALIILALSVLGSMAVAVLVPVKSMSLDAGIMQAFQVAFQNAGLAWLTRIMAVLVALGAVAQVSTWIVGPTRGLLATGRNGSLPPLFQRENSAGMPVAIMYIQAGVVSLFALVFLLMPSVNSAYWVLTALTAQSYLVMYVLMFLAGIVLRIKRPDVERPYRIPGGMAGMVLVAGIGLATSVFCIVVGFVPPAGFAAGRTWAYVAIILGGLVLLMAPPFVMAALKKPSWIPAQGGDDTKEA